MKTVIYFSSPIYRISCLQVFHAISFFENEFQIGCEPLEQSPSKQKGQSSLKEFGFTKKSSIQLTAEQARIAHHQLSSVSKLFQSFNFWITNN